MTYPATKLEPWDFQKKAWEKASEKDYFFYAAEMGTGKSKMAIDYANGKQCKSILIICPKAVMPVWPVQFDLHSHEHFNVYSANDQAGTTKKKVIDKVTDIQSFIIHAIDTNTPYAIVINYDIIWRPGLGPIYNDKFQMVDTGLLKSLNWDLMILDESHRIKAPNGKASWAAMRIGKQAQYRLALTGTPASKIHDLYAQYRYLDTKIFGASFAKFKNQFCVMGGHLGRQIMGYKNQDVIKGKLDPTMFRIKTADAISLPDSKHEMVECELPAKLFKEYKTFEKDMIATIEGEEIVAENALIKMLRLSQLTGGFLKVDKDDEGKQIHTIKIDNFIDFVSDFPDNEPLVIFCRFTYELQTIREKLEKMGRTVGEISGRCNDYDKWFTEESINTLVCQIRSGSMGIDLVRSKYALFFSTGPFILDYAQSLARILRAGQLQKVTFYHFHVKNTIDAKILKAMNRSLADVNNLIDSLGDDEKDLSDVNAQIASDLISSIKNE